MYIPRGILQFIQLWICVFIVSFLILDRLSQSTTHVTGLSISQEYIMALGADLIRDIVQSKLGQSNGEANLVTAFGDDISTGTLVTATDGLLSTGEKFNDQIAQLTAQAVAIEKDGGDASELRARIGKMSASADKAEAAWQRRMDKLSKR